MKKPVKSTHVLDDKISETLAVDILPTIPAPEVASRLKSRLMQRVQESKPKPLFVFAHEGDWRDLGKGISVKMLNKSGQGKAFLLRMAENSEILPHLHKHDEESLVLEGDVWIEDVYCSVGDFHFMTAGTRHNRIHTERGCLLYVKQS